MTGLPLTWSKRPVCTWARNPGSETSSRYGPIGTFGMTQAPVSSVAAVRLAPVSVCVAVTETPGSTPPLASWTVPVMEACAWSAVGTNRIEARAMAS